jgi:conjugal transfer/entry exclusion protein
LEADVKQLEQQFNNIHKEMTEEEKQAVYSCRSIDCVLSRVCPHEYGAITSCLDRSQGKKDACTKESCQIMACFGEFYQRLTLTFEK